MLKKDVIAHYGALAHAAGALEISRQAVEKWGDVVPLESALALEILTSGQLQVDRSLYPNLARAIEVSEQVRESA